MPLSSPPTRSKFHSVVAITILVAIVIFLLVAPSVEREIQLIALEEGDVEDVEWALEKLCHLEPGMAALKARFDNLKAERQTLILGVADRTDCDLTDLTPGDVGEDDEELALVEDTGETETDAPRELEVESFPEVESMVLDDIRFELHPPEFGASRPRLGVIVPTEEVDTDESEWAPEPSRPAEAGPAEAEPAESTRPAEAPERIQREPSPARTKQPSTPPQSEPESEALAPGQQAEEAVEAQTPEPAPEDEPRGSSGPEDDETQAEPDDE